MSSSNYLNQRGPLEALSLGQRDGKVAVPGDSGWRHSCISECLWDFPGELECRRELLGKISWPRGRLSCALCVCVSVCDPKFLCSVWVGQMRTLGNTFAHLCCWPVRFLRLFPLVPVPGVGVCLCPRAVCLVYVT